MAGNRRASRNRCQTAGPGGAPWFNINMERQRKRNKLAKASRRKNRK